MAFKYLEKYKSEISRCVRCGGCQATCPTYTVTGDESMVARGRMALVEAVIDGRLGITEGFARRINSCLDCKACIASCPSGVRIDEIIYAAKADITANRGCSPIQKILARGMSAKAGKHPYILRFAGMLKRLFYDPLPDSLPLPSPLRSGGKKRLLPDIGGIPLRERYRGIQKVENRRGRVAFFVGCATNLVHQHIGEAAIEVLKHNNIEVVLADDEVCCGIPFLSNGDRETAEKLMRKNVETFTSMEVDAVVTCCATCGSTLRNYPVWLDDEGAKKLSPAIMDIHYYLAHYTDYQKGLGELNRSVTWHDPCHLSQGEGIKDEPREILTSIPGLEFIEMKKPCYCCGFGGEASFKDYDMSISIAGQKVESIRDSGADAVATGCPACKIHMEDALHHEGLKTPITHTVEYLAESYRAGRR